MSVHVVAVITAQPGSEDAVREALQALVGPTRAEAGNISYDLSESQSTPGAFVTVEEWTEAADLETHMQSDHIAATFAAVGDQLAEPPAIHPLSPIDVQ